MEDGIASAGPDGAVPVAKVHEFSQGLAAASARLVKLYSLISDKEMVTLE
jgi:hypothetical protein